MPHPDNAADTERDLAEQVQEIKQEIATEIEETLAAGSPSDPTCGDVDPRADIDHAARNEVAPAGANPNVPVASGLFLQFDDPPDWFEVPYRVALRFAEILTNHGALIPPLTKTELAGLSQELGASIKAARDTGFSLELDGKV